MPDRDNCQDQAPCPDSGDSLGVYLAWSRRRGASYRVQHSHDLGAQEQTAIGGAAQPFLSRCMICLCDCVLGSLHRRCKSGRRGRFVLEGGPRVVGLEEIKIDHTKIEVSL